MTEVHLAIYDLSQGMARNLSAQFLGPQHTIDMVPHTGLLVFGKEYFFGGGIQAVESGAFRRTSGMHPVQTKRLGTTTVAQQDFEAWCQSIGSTRYNVQTYDLLQCNCNHFSNTAALQGLQLPQGVPSWILEVPQQFISSPMGQTIRPMLEQMQITQAAPVQATSLLSASPVVSAMPATMAPSSSSSNPWANLDTSNVNTSNKPSATASEPALKASMSTSSSAAAAAVAVRKVILQKYSKPMLSNDTQALSICTSKLSPHLKEEMERTSLAKLTQTLISQDPSRSRPLSYSSHEETLIDAVVPELWRLLQEGTTVTFILLYLRLVVLAFPSTTAVERCMAQLMQALVEEPPTHIFPTPAARSLAWCVVSNYTGSCRPTQVPTWLVEAGIRDWNHEVVQVRQAACTFLYNFVVSGHLSPEDEETVVSLVCSSLEGVVEEADPTTRLRRLVVGARVVFGVAPLVPSSSDAAASTFTTNNVTTSATNEMAKDLVQELGFLGLLQELSTVGDTQHPDAKECQLLALELMGQFR